MIAEKIYQTYSYSYPHKSAYRALHPMSIRDIWDKELSNPLFFYMHIPFCEMRCGFCNLFTVANPKFSTTKYLDAVEREMNAYTDQLGRINFSNFAIGGGTPTFLTVEELERLFGLMTEFGVDSKTYFGSIETSPKTLTPEKLSLIEEMDIARVSMGIQSWTQEEVHALGRPQEVSTTEKAVRLLADSSVAEFNLDLIYGGKGQTTKSFLYSVEKTIEYSPTEIFLYPLYVRQLTGLGKRSSDAAQDSRHEIYLAARDFLLTNGYEQLSLRCFRRPTKTRHIDIHRSAIDNSIGTGAGARSYTSQMHYSSEYAVGRKEIINIIESYSNRAFGTINHGIRLNIDEQKRRFILKSLMDGGKLYPQDYHDRFGQNVFEDFTILNDFLEKNWLTKTNDTYHLSMEGMTYEDAIGVKFYSEDILTKMDAYEWK